MKHKYISYKKNILPQAMYVNQLLLNMAISQLLPHNADKKRSEITTLAKVSTRKRHRHRHHHHHRHHNYRHHHHHHHHRHHLVAHRCVIRRSLSCTKQLVRGAQLLQLENVFDKDCLVFGKMFR